MSKIYKKIQVIRKISCIENQIKLNIWEYERVRGGRGVGDKEWKKRKRD